MTLRLQVVTESALRGQRVYPKFEQDQRFHPNWWRNGCANSPVSYCRFLDNGDEVGRAKILPGSHSYTGYQTWCCPPDGATEIALIEIRQDLRRSERRYGSSAVRAIGRRYGHPVTAMSLNEMTDGFWRSLGWREHTQPGDDWAQILFSSS